MKALKTIVATAVIVFALTTVAMAGVRHVNNRSDAVPPAAAPATTQTHQAAGVTLTDDQFARLLRAVDGQGVKLHAKQADRDTTRARVRYHSPQKASDSAVHVQAQQHTQSQNASFGTHNSGGTHDGGTHVGSTHNDSGAHDGGACND